MKKIGLFFGGLSNEAEVSIMSAKNVVKYFDYKRYQLVLIYWHKKDGQFYIAKNINNLSIASLKKAKLEDFSKLFDKALLMTHGRYGEDGVLQALLESQKIKYCGCRVLGSALCMDKAVFKDLMAAQNIRQVKYVVLDYNSSTKEELTAQEKKVSQAFRFPLFIKPANSGSSVGITKITKPNQLALAIKSALKHDSKIIIEEGLVNPREVEVAVLGNKKLLVATPGELQLAKDFYDYDDKYKLGEAQPVIPAKINSAQAKEIKILAAKAYKLANCQGFARVDFFVANNKIYLNEINTLPGFTDISMFPKEMNYEGLNFQKLINKIIELGY